MPNLTAVPLCPHSASAARCNEPNMSDAATTAISLISRYWTSAASKAWLLLGLTMLMWGGNVVASRLAIGQVSPMALVALRWILVCGLLTLLPRRQLAADCR